MRHTRLSLVLIALALVVAACTSDSDDTTTTAASTPTETTTTTTTTEPPPTTQAVTTTTVNADVVYSEPRLNPRSDSTVPHRSIDLTPYTGLDRCAWTETTDDTIAGFRQDCVDAATDHFKDSQVDPAYNNPTVVASFSGTDVLAVIRQPVEATDHVCVINEHEIVTSAYIDDVEAILGAGVEQTDGDLSGGLNAYWVAVDPVEATSALVAAGIPASPRYVLMPSPIWMFGPAGPALPADPGVVDMQGTLSVDDNPTITVIDTGAFGTEPTGTDPLVDDPPYLSPALRGHGQFIAGIINRLLLLPSDNTNVVERSALTKNGRSSQVITEKSIVGAIDSSVADELSEGGVINLSLGTYTCRGDHLPLELAAYLGEMVANDLDIAVVAAAGNDSHEAAAEGDLLGSGDPPFWPAGFSDPSLVTAAFPPAVEPQPGDWSDETLADIGRLRTAIAALVDDTNVIGVGALVYDATANDWLPAAFSNQVAATVWAPGANIVSNHPLWAGFAQWDGTSFAAPHVAALIASCVDLGVPNSYRNALTQVTESGNCSQ